jgi:hypothetical protein
MRQHRTADTNMELVILEEAGQKEVSNPSALTGGQFGEF